jgi:WbqC-like protein family
MHQPQYLPYPGFFHKLTLADALIVMDDVQYDKRFTNRNKILAPQGPIWLTVPIDKSDKFGRNMDVKVNNSLSWREEHWKRMSYSYRNAKWFDSYSGFFEELYGSEYEFLCDLDMDITKRLMGWLGVHPKVFRESELNVRGNGTERLVNACKAVGADTYVSGRGGKNYMDEKMFAESGISLIYQSYMAKPYPQRFSTRFVPDLSVADMLFNVGPESAKLVAESDETVTPRTV